MVVVQGKGNSFHNCNPSPQYDMLATQLIQMSCSVEEISTVDTRQWLLDTCTGQVALVSHPI